MSINRREYRTMLSLLIVIALIFNALVVAHVGRTGANDKAVELQMRLDSIQSLPVDSLADARRDSIQRLTPAPAEDEEFVDDDADRPSRSRTKRKGREKVEKVVPPARNTLTDTLSFSTPR